MLSIGKLGSGSAAADYYVKRQAGCELDYYSGDGERPGVWCGSGAAALGLAGHLTPEGERALRALLSGCSPGGDRLVGQVLRSDPRSRVPADLVVTAVEAAAQRRGVPVDAVLGDERLGQAYLRAQRAVAAGRRRPVWPAAGIPADVAGRLLSAAGVDPAEALRGRRGRDRFGAAMRHLDGRVDVRVSGLDLTLSPPKSVSVLFALGSEGAVSQVRAAHETAVAAALEYMERVCATGLRGHHGGVTSRYVATDGLIGVAFEHRTSRENDPQLHTHVVVANLLRGVDGRWGALNTREVYRQAQTGGYVYQAVLRGELTARLGVTWSPVRKGQAEIATAPRPLLALFSRRRAAIRAELHRLGRDDANASRTVTLATRPAKRPGGGLRDGWAERAAAAGFAPADVAGWLHRLPAAPTLPAPEALAARLLGNTGLTERASTFDRRDLLRGVCEAIPAGARVTVAQLRELATRVVRSPDAVPVLPQEPVGERRYSTAELLAAERAAVVHATRRADDGVAMVDPSLVGEVLGDAGLSREQEVMVRRLTGSGAGVEVVVGPAGSGKTRALAAARAAWAAAGVPVSGTAVAAIAARVLEEGSGIGASSLARLLRDVHAVDAETLQPVGLPPGGVLVVDEAGMLGTRRIAELITVTQGYRTKLVLVGDPHQLPEIEAGGLFAALAEALPAVRLGGNQRQRRAWERSALADLRAGDVLAAVDAYRGHGRLRTAEETQELAERLVDDVVCARRRVGPLDVLVVASSRADARRLNDVLRAALVGAGELGKEALTVGVRGVRGVREQREFRVGEQVVVTANDYRRALLNGTRAQVVDVDPAAATMTVQCSDGRVLALPRSYLEAGRVGYAYALTAHRAQGMTVEVAMLWGTAALTRETGYVAMSRGRRANYLYATWEGLRRDLGSELDRPRVGTAPSASERVRLLQAAVVERLERSGAQRLASSWLSSRRQPPDRRVDRGVDRAG